MDVVQQYPRLSDSSFEGKSRETRSGFAATQASSGGIFLLIVALTLQAARRQVRQLASLEMQAEDACRAKNQFMQRMQESETRERMIMETMFSALITTDEAGKIDSFNPATEQMFGCKAAEIIGKNALVLIPENKRLRYSVAMLGGADGTLREDIRTTARRRDGTEFTVSPAISNMMLDDRPTYTAIVMAITDRLEAEMKLLEAKGERRNPAFTPRASSSRPCAAKSARR